MDPGTHLRRKKRFHINIFPFAVCTWYCLRGPMNVASPYVSHDPVIVFCTAMFVPTVMSGRLLAMKLYLAAAASCDCQVHRSVSSLLCCHSGKKAHWCMGRVSCMGWPYSVWAGESPSLTDSVWQYCMRAWHSIDLSKNHPVHAALSIFFIAFTVAPAFPLLWG